jgi:type VI secretion system protein ImpA
MNSQLEELSQAVSDEMPSGENLEYDPQFREMETLFWPESESMVEDDESGGAEPDWKGVEKIANELREKTRDLRLQVYASIASIHTRGLLEFRDNLKLLVVYLDTFWDSVHPQLDPDDNNDPTLRLSTLQNLDDHRFITMALERMKLVELKGMGEFGLREVDIALGKESREEDEEVPDINVIRQAFVQSEPEYLAALREAVNESIGLLKEMDRIWIEKADDPSGLSFDNADKALKRVAAVLDEYIPVPAGGQAGDAEPGQGEAGGAPAMSGAINGRADVVRVLDKICDYYSVHEPSSPIPLLLRRAQRLVEKSFLEILEDMVPDGVKQAKIVSGSTDND